MNDSEFLKEAIRTAAYTLGFDMVGFATAELFAEDRAVTLKRLQKGLMDGLPWYHKERVLKGTDPQLLLPGACSIISIGISYYKNQVSSGSDTPRGRVARYAWGDDYHRVLKQRLNGFTETISRMVGYTINSRVFVDDGPMLDRAVARRAGTGWYGKNTMILTPKYGSWVFLGQVLTDLCLKPDPPLKKSCGTCVRCIQACPTGAIVEPYVLNNSICISYQTIENRGPIPIDFRPFVADWVFGCDICQDVCPVNYRVQESRESAFGKIRFSTVDLIELLELSDEEFRVRYNNSPIRRAKRIGLQRNACVVLGNHGDQAAVPALIRALTTSDLLVRGHAAWALGRLGGESAMHALISASREETDPWVQEEIGAALSKVA